MVCCGTADTSETKQQTQMKKYVITLSQVFPVTHKRAGEPTGFRENFRKTKLHTLRANLPYWEGIFKEIDAGTACLCVRQWSGRPYMSKQVELACLTREDGIGLQKLEFKQKSLLGGYKLQTIDGKPWSRQIIAENDGLSLEDWKEWFRNYDKTKPMAVIHFTPFRYR